jgi:protein-arginine kinase activator protein McsA
MSANPLVAIIIFVKLCSKCHAEKPESDFFVRDKKTQRLHAQCKTCYQEHRTLYYATHYATYRESYLQRARLRRQKLRNIFRKNMIKYLSNRVCVDCGENDIRVLELDHLDPQLKEFTVSQAVRLGKSWDEVVQELKKCQILCANCHKKRTAEQFGWYKAM